MTQDTRIGTTLSGYRIESLIGRGGMGAVYLAEHIGLQRKVALKILSPDLADDAKFRDRFVRESRIGASLEDPNIVPIYEAGEADGVLFIAMRYVRGTDLRALIESGGALPPERTVSIVSHVASALDAAHEQGLVHRDVKPANVLLAPGDDTHPDKVYLSDFGLTKRASSDSGITATGQFVGDPRLRGAGAVRGEAPHPSGRRLLAGLRPVRVPDGRGTIPPGPGCRPDVRPSHGAGPEGHRHAPRAARGHRRRGGQGHGQAP